MGSHEKDILAAPLPALQTGAVPVPKRRRWPQQLATKLRRASGIAYFALLHDPAGGIGRGNATAVTSFSEARSLAFSPIPALAAPPGHALVQVASPNGSPGNVLTAPVPSVLVVTGHQ